MSRQKTIKCSQLNNSMSQYENKEEELNRSNNKIHIWSKQTQSIIIKIICWQPNSSIHISNKTCYEMKKLKYKLFKFTWMRMWVLAEGEGPTISTTLPGRRGRRWSGGRSSGGREVETLLMKVFAVSLVVNHSLTSIVEEAAVSLSAFSLELKKFIDDWLMIWWNEMMNVVWGFGICGFLLFKREGRRWVKRRNRLKLLQINNHVVNAFINLGM